MHLVITSRINQNLIRTFTQSGCFKFSNALSISSTKTSWVKSSSSWISCETKKSKSAFQKFPKFDMISKISYYKTYFTQYNWKLSSFLSKKWKHNISVITNQGEGKKIHGKGNKKEWKNVKGIDTTNLHYSYSPS